MILPLPRLLMYLHLLQRKRKVWNEWYFEAASNKYQILTFIQMNTSANKNKCDINGQGDSKKIEITIISPSYTIPNPRAVMVKMICEQINFIENRENSTSMKSSICHTAWEVNTPAQKLLNLFRLLETRYSVIYGLFKQCSK